MSGDAGVQTTSAPSSATPTATTTGAGTACATCGHGGQQAVPDSGLEVSTTTAPTGTSPVDRLLMGTTWDRESFRIALDALGLAATLLLYIKVNE